MMNRVAWLLAAAALAVPAQAQEVSIDPDHISAVLKGAGYPAENYNDNPDYRQILSESGSFKFLVEMYDCTDGKACQTIGFYSNFPMETPPTKERLDAYSGPREGARLSLVRRGEARLDQELDLGDATGISDEEFLARLKTWETVLAGVKDYLARPADAPPAAASADAAEAAAPPAPATNAS
jgi:hypothetical protein